MQEHSQHAEHGGHAHEQHAGHEGHQSHGQGGTSWRTAASATLHCLTGCAIGETLGMVLATWWGWSTWPAVGLAVVLAFVFGYSLTIAPVMRAGATSLRGGPGRSTWSGPSRTGRARP